MEFRILGPLEVASDDGPVEVRWIKPRALLALLLVHANRVVARDQLIDDLWEGAPPESATATLQTYVSQLRKSLELESLHTRRAGYVLEMGVDELDAFRFERLLEAVPGVDDPDPRAIAARLREALLLWRGPALAEFRGALWAQPEAARLEELRLTAVERLTDARLALGEHAALVSELESLVAEHPLRERLWAQLMLALYRSDRQGDALRAFGRLRRHLGEELGIDPSKELAGLETAILRQEPGLDWQQPESELAASAATWPTGEVTFLFTDIVGSTKLWEERREEMRRAVAGQHEVVCGAVGDRGGIVVKSTGDGLMAAFDDAASAVAAAVDAQLALADAEWPVSVALRMGLHTGAARAGDGDYHGPAVNRAARVASAAHPGQILVSAATGALLDGWSLRDLGEHRLHGLPPMRLHQVLAPGLADDFPAPASALLPVDLPSPPTTFVGRATEVEAVGRLLDGHRLVTLTGVGGCGKTRLAIEVAVRLTGSFLDGVRFADLAVVSDETQVADAVVRAVGLVDDPTAADPVDRLATHLRDRAVLCVLDNCEHVIDACAALSEAIVARGGPSRLLATSREPLGVIGEQLYVVPSLDADTEATALFADRATEARADFTIDDTDRATIAELCRRLDGLPLAIELAAARTPHVSPAQLLERLEDRFQLLVARRRSDRHRTLAAMLDWSHDLLSSHDQAALRRLAVFPGSFSLEAAEHVVGAGDIVETLGSLVAKSLVQAVDDGARLRYRMLETVRLYAQTKLIAAGEAEDCQARNRDWVLEWVEQDSLDERWFGDTDYVAAEGPNIRAALEWSAAESDAESIARIAAGIDWNHSDAWREGIRWCEVAAAAADTIPSELRAQLYAMLWLLGRHAIRGPDDWTKRTAWAQRAIDASHGAPSPPHALALTALGASRAAEVVNASNPALAGRVIELVEAGVAMSEQYSVGWRMFCHLLAGMTHSALATASLSDAESVERHYGAGIATAPAEPPYLGLRAIVCVCLAVNRLVAGDARSAVALAREAGIGEAFLRRRGPELALARTFVLALDDSIDVDLACAELRTYDEAARRADWALGPETVVVYGGILAALREDWEAAARLLAAGQRSRHRTPNVTALLYVAFSDQASVALGADRSRQLFEEGRAMPLAAAREAALG